MQPATNCHERKKKIQAKGREVDLVEQIKEIDKRAQRVSAVLVKIQMDDMSSDVEDLEEIDNYDNDIASKSDSLDSDFY